MRGKPSTAMRLLAFAMCAALTGAPALAQGHGKGHDKGDKHEERDHAKAEKHAEKEVHKEDKARREDIRPGTYFSDSHRTVVRTYYTDHYGGAHGCPPGLAKKHNGCLPPGQAKKYVVGEPLRVSYYAVPRPVLVQLPPAPVGYRYVSVNGDILLVAIGTMIVIDALDNLMR